jgi:hypothetical protein
VTVQRSPFLTVVGAGDDHIADTGVVSIGQAHLASNLGAAETTGACSSVEVGDEVSGGGEHDRVQPSGLVGNPRREGILCGGGEVAAVDAAVIKVEVDCLWFAFAEGE